MPSSANHVLDHAGALPEATLLCPGALLHLGSRAAVDQALSWLARAGRLLHICRGVYMQPVETRFGSCAPSVEKAIDSLSALWGETIVSFGASAANVLGLATQNPVLFVYLTPVPTADCASMHRKCICVMRRAGNSWRRTAEPATSFAPWHGSARERSRTLSRRSPTSSPTTTWPSWRRRAIMPAWLAEPVSALVADG